MFLNKKKKVYEYLYNSKKHLVRESHKIKTQIIFYTYTLLMVLYITPMMEYQIGVNQCFGNSMMRSYPTQLEANPIIETIRQEL